MTGVGTRIRKARETVGMTQAALALAVGVSQQAVMELESGRARGTKHGAKFARALGQDPLWLETGDGRMREAAKAQPPHAEVDMTVSAAAGFERLPVFDLRFKEARTLFSHDADAAGYFLFASVWLRRLTPTPASQLAVVLMAGDAMEPTLSNGDHVLIDGAQINLRREGIYALKLDTTAMIRRVVMHPGSRRLTVAADNSRYHAFEGLDPDALEAVGRAIWTGRKLD